MASPIEQSEDPNWNLKTICHELRTVSQKWFKIGIQLGIPRHVLEKFKEEELDPLSAVVDYVLKGNETDPPGPKSWKSIVTALKSIEETGLAENVNKKYCIECDSNAKQDGGRNSTMKFQPPQPESQVGALDPVVQKDLKFHLKENIKKITAQYASYVDNLRAAIEEKKVPPKVLRAYLLSLNFSSKGNEDDTLMPMSDKKSELEKQDTIADIFSFLTTECASFLNYEIFQNIGDKFGYSNKEYHEQLQDFAKKHKISEIAKLIPLPKPKIGTTELVLKFDVDQTCRLAKVLDLQTSIAKVLHKLPSALQILSIEDGCVVVTFLIASSIADALFTPDTVFTSQQAQELQAASVLWMKCNGHTFHFVQTKSQVLSRLKQQLKCPVCFDNPKILQCYHHAYCQHCLDGLTHQDQQGQHTIACPICHQVTPVPASEVADFKSNFCANQIMREDQQLKDAFSSGASASLVSSHSKRKAKTHSVIKEEHVHDKEKIAEEISKIQNVTKEVLEDLEFTLKCYVDEVSIKYAIYVNCISRIIEEKGVPPKDLRLFLISLPAFKKTFQGQKLAVLPNELENTNTIDEIFCLLCMRYASFMNYDIFHVIMKNYNIPEDREELKYPDHLRDYCLKHTISEFVQINPLLKILEEHNQKSSLPKMILKFDIEATCSLARVVDLKKSIAKILGLKKTALVIIDVKEGCIVVTFLIPTSVANVLFTPDTVFTPQQEDQLKAASVLWMKCNGYTFQFQDGKFQSPQIQAVKKAEEQLTPAICLDNHTDPEFVQCGHAYSQQPIKKEAGEIEIYPHAITVE